MQDTLPIALLILVIAAFFLFAQRHFTAFGWPQSLLRVLVALPLFFSGVVLHWMRMSATAEIVPPAFPAPVLLVVVSGIFEIAGGIGLFVPRFRRLAGLLIAILMVAIFPANLYVAGRDVGGLRMPGVPARTAMQMVYIVLVLLASFGLPRHSKTDPD